jgi:hypothetical protein
LGVANRDQRSSVRDRDGAYRANVIDSNWCGHSGFRLALAPLSVRTIAFLAEFAFLKP